MKTHYNYITNNTIGIDWLKQGWDIFKNNAITWLLIMLATIVIVGLFNYFPVGRFIGVIITPILFGGIYLTLDKFHKGQNIVFMGLFSALKTEHTRKQVFIIGLMGIAIIALTYIFKNMPGSNLQIFLGNHYSSGFRQYGSLDEVLSVLISYVWAIALSLSVPLVCLQNLPAIDALKLSLKTVIANIKPLVVYSLMVVVLIIVAIIPVVLGLFVAMPVIFCANYAVYDSLFNDISQNANTENESTLEKKTLEDYRK